MTSVDGDPGADGHPGADGDPGADHRLLEELRGAVARHDPVPASLDGLGRRLLSWRDPDAELAVLVADSRELAGAVRDAGEEVLLRFDAGGITITLEAFPAQDGAYLVTGQIEPGQAGVVEIRSADIGEAAAGDPPVRTDAWGRFQAHLTGAGRVSLRWTPDDPRTRPVTTAWVVV